MTRLECQLGLLLGNENINNKVQKCLTKARFLQGYYIPCKIMSYLCLKGKIAAYLDIYYRYFRERVKRVSFY